MIEILNNPLFMAGYQAGFKYLKYYQAKNLIYNEKVTNWISYILNAKDTYEGLNIVVHVHQITQDTLQKFHKILEKPDRGKFYQSILIVCVVGKIAGKLNDVIEAVQIVTKVIFENQHLADIKILSVPIEIYTIPIVYFSITTSIVKDIQVIYKSHMKLSEKPDEAKQNQTLKKLHIRYVVFGTDLTNLFAMALNSFSLAHSTVPLGMFFTTFIIKNVGIQLYTHYTVIKNVGIQLYTHIILQELELRLTQIRKC